MKPNFRKAAFNILGGALAFAVTSAHANDLYYAPSEDLPVKAWPSDGFDHMTQRHVVVYYPPTGKIYKYTESVPDGTGPYTKSPDVKMVAKGLNARKFVFLEYTTGKVEFNSVLASVPAEQAGKFRKAYDAYYARQPAPTAKEDLGASTPPLPWAPVCRFAYENRRPDHIWDPRQAQDCRRDI